MHAVTRSLRQSQNGTMEDTDETPALSNCSVDIHFFSEESEWTAQNNETIAAIEFITVPQIK